MNLADPELELLDPTPNVHAMFVHFDKLFFWTKLASRAVVRWSKKMYSCAGICSYDRQLCDIALSEPLLKLRPRKDLVETLLHEMIHAYLFITNSDRDRDGHGPNFKAHMHRINKAAGLNISIYHDFHDEVNLYRTHVWRCDGPCQKVRPYFGIVRRSNNRAPSPTDFWWNDHKRKCGGTFVKIKEPEKKGKAKKENTKTKQSSTTSITKFITTTGKSNINTLNDTSNVLKPCNKINTKINSSTVVITQKSPTNTVNVNKPKPATVFGGKGQTLLESDKSPGDFNKSNPLETVRSIWANKKLCDVTDVTEKVCNVWAKKEIQGNVLKVKQPSPKITSPRTKHTSPPKKIMKIDDYFKTKAESLLKSVYGEDMKVHVSGNQSRLSVSVENKPAESSSPRDELVDCPVCAAKFKQDTINQHLDECLNREVIHEISTDSIPSTSKKIVEIQNKDVTSKTEQIKTSNWLTIDVIEIKEETEHSHKVKGRRNSMTSITCNEQIVEVLEVKAHNARKRKSTDCISSVEEPHVEIKAGSSRDSIEKDHKACPCCGETVDKPLFEHLDECLSFFDNNTTIPEEPTSTSFTQTIVIDDEDDRFDETQTHNATGTKCPCPCCFNMIEMEEMNEHLDSCLN